jgi:hypothetical protein
MRLDFLEYLFEGTEDGPRIPHPENAIFTSSSEAKRALTGLKEIVNNADQVTIKWDGEIALFFGRDANGQFFCSDKYMYPKGIQAKSPAEWLQYDQTKKSGTLRPDLYKKLELIWPALEQSVQNTPVAFKGDLMFAGVRKLIKGHFEFEGPTVKYSIQANSPVGQLINGKVGLIVVHGMNNGNWDGKTGIVQGTPIAIMPPNYGSNFQTGTYDKKLDVAFKTAETTLARLGGAADSFFAALGTKSARGAIETFFNKTITNQTNLKIGKWLEQSDPANYKKLIGGGILSANAQGFEAVTAIYNAMYQLKFALEQTFNSQVQGITQGIKDKTGKVVAQGGEGFVYNSPTNGMVKLVGDNFRKQHFQK